MVACSGTPPIQSVALFFCLNYLSDIYDLHLTLTNDKTPIKEPTKKTLKDFIEGNQRLLTVMGVFVALTAFFSSKSQFGIYLSFISFIMFLLLYWEFWISFPKSEESSTNLKVFEYFSMLLLFFVTGQILISYKDILLTYSSVIIKVSLFYIYSITLIKIYNKYKIYLLVRNLAERDEKLAPVIRSLGFIVAIEIVLFLTFFTWNEFFENIYLYATQNFVNKSISFGG